MQRSTLAVLCALSFCGTQAHAVTITVPGDQPTIQDAVDAAVAGDEILVAPGTYFENVSINKDIALLSSGGRAVTTIDGTSSAGALGTITITGGTSDVQIGAVGQGFTILGIDNGSPGIENAAVYFQGSHSGAEIYDNEIVAREDAGLITEYGATISGFVIDGNEFSGMTYFDPPAGEGFSMQFDIPNVPRQLVVMGCGGCTNTSAVTFSNNVISGNAGGINIDGDEQGNTLCTLDGDGMIITGNTFAGTTTRFGASLRVRGPSTSVSGNNFSSAGLTPTTGHIYAQSTGANLSVIALANTFDKGVYVDGAIGTIGHSVQTAALGAPSGVIVDILPGTYTEQVIVDGKDLTLRGSGSGSTTVASPASLDVTFTTSGSNKPIVTAMNAESVVLQDLTVDGMGLGNANNRFVGVGYWNAGGAIVDCDVVNIIDTPFSGVQHGVGILTANDTGGPYDLEIDGVEVSEFQKNAMVISGSGLTVDVHDCVVTGKGWTSTTAQNGIQIGYGTGGTVTNNTISEIGYTGPTYAAGGLLMISGSNIDATGTHDITNVQVPAWWQDTPGTIGGINASGDVEYGSLIYNLTAAAHRNGSGAGPVQASPWDASDSEPPSAQTGITINYTGGCFSGVVASSPLVGIYGYSGGEPLTILAENMRIADFDYGLVADGAATTIDITNSFIAGNTSAGFDNTLSGASQDATQNWWGASDGPSGVGTGSGDAVLGAGVDFDPWRLDDASSTPCGFTPVATNEVTPMSPGSCIAGPSLCVTVPVEITRSDNAQMRGFSVDLQLTNLELCGTEITEGTYLSSIGGTAFQVLDNGGGSYTVDCAILGLPCGQDAMTGNLFDLAVTTGGTDGIGTVTVTDIIFRDCENIDIPGAPGAPLDIDIDTMAPSPVADLATSQVTSGNDGDGTTAVTVNFTAPGDAAVTEVYRAPYGTTTTNAYPEYDDLAGASAPAVPTYPPAAPWSLTSVTLSGEDDETVDRGFWYYVVFTKDVCGNISAVSNLSAGSLNYHLGDVSDGFVMGQGDNMVASEDISLLGAHYGASLIFNDSFNYLDVGPTADGTTSTLPETDDLVAFEDLILFAINFDQVSRPEEWVVAADLESGSVLPSVRLEFDANQAGFGSTQARLVLDSNEQLVQGFHVVVEGVRAASSGSLLDGQNVFFETLDSDEGLVVDGAGLGQPLRGAGELAVLEVLPGQLPRIVVADLRDHANQSIGKSASVTPAKSLLPNRATLADESVVTTTEVLGARPNPTSGPVDIRFRIANRDRVSIQVFDVEGRLVRSLVNQEMPAGDHSIQWDGRSDLGDRVGMGVYLYRFQGDGLETTQKLYLYR